MGDAGGYFCGDCLLGFRDAAPGSGVVACPRCGRAVPGTPGSAGSRRVGGTPSTLPFRETAAAGSAPGRYGTVAGRHPRRIGPYRLEEEIGRGGMGIVYRARPREGGPTVALKRMRDGATASRADRERFLREARLAGHLRHPGVVPVLDAGEDGPELYFVMPLVPGAGLDERLRGGPMPAADAAECIAAVARAVGHAHARGVIHRDLKPANVLIDPEHGPRVTDFGLARPSDPSRRLTETGELFGTPAYMAPELLEGASPTRAADIYALGAILYECLTGTPPHGTGGFLDLTARALRNDPLPPRRFRPELPPAVDAICLTALERRPAARYADAEALATDLERFARGEAVKARPPGPASRAWRRIRRRPALASALAAALPVAAVAVLAVLAVGGRARPEGARAGLTLRVDPPGAVVLLTHRGGRSLDVPRALGTTPLEGAGVPAGDARLRVEAPGRASVTFPLALAVGARAEVTLRLPSAADVPDDMVVVVPPPAGAGDDLPRRPFLVDRCEVTGAAYKRYCEATGARTPRHWKQRRIPAGRDDHPVVNVTAAEAEAYAVWAGRRLPTAAEWRAAAAGADARRYPWGGRFRPALANSADHGVGGTLPVGRLPAGASPAGVLDLAGNVAEWTATPHPLDAALRLVAGGHYDSPAADCAISSRRFRAPDAPAMTVGFRCVKDLPPFDRR